jgi:ceramide glucosyltransferase
MNVFFSFWSLLFVVWMSAVGLHIWGALLARRQFPRSARRYRGGNLRHDLEPISILKPVKGVETGLSENLESFFQLDYPSFEILFSVADSDDPALPIIKSLMAKYSKVTSRLLIGDVKIGLNPKVNNIVKSYAQAKHNWVLISDCNVRVRRDYLYCTTEKFTPNVGIVTAAVSGYAPEGLGSWIESLFLNTFYCRWMLISKELGEPVVLGKSMLFRKSDAERFGDLKTLGKYLAEDYMAGQEMCQLGLEIEMMSMPVLQPLHRKTLKAFWARHVRWGRIRKSQAPFIFIVEPFLSLWLSGIMGAIAMNVLFGFEVSWVIGIHLLIWMAADLMLVRACRSEITWKTPAVWLLKELLYLPLWLHIGSGKTVMWRGRKLVLQHGGLLKLES